MRIWTLNECLGLYEVDFMNGIAYSYLCQRSEVVDRGTDEMGDRSLIVVKAKAFPTPITFYGHWSGEDNVTAVRNVLRRTGRIGDVSYLTAQIFYEFAKLGNYDGELSFGIETSEYSASEDLWMDNPTIIVDADTGEYTLEGVVHTEFAKVKV
jgi:hypothetical protein